MIQRILKKLGFFIILENLHYERKKDGSYMLNMTTSNGEKCKSRFSCIQKNDYEKSWVDCTLKMEYPSGSHISQGYVKKQEDVLELLECLFEADYDPKHATDEVVNEHNKIDREICKRIVNGDELEAKTFLLRFTLKSKVIEMRNNMEKRRLDIRDSDVDFLIDNGFKLVLDNAMPRNCIDKSATTRVRSLEKIICGNKIIINISYYPYISEFFYSLILSFNEYEISHPFANIMNCGGHEGSSLATLLIDTYNYFILKLERNEHEEDKNALNKIIWEFHVLIMMYTDKF